MKQRSKWQWIDGDTFTPLQFHNSSSGHLAKNLHTMLLFSVGMPNAAAEALFLFVFARGDIDVATVLDNVDVRGVCTAGILFAFVGLVVLALLVSGITTSPLLLKFGVVNTNGS